MFEALCLVRVRKDTLPLGIAEFQLRDLAAHIDPTCEHVEDDVIFNYVDSGRTTKRSNGVPWRGAREKSQLSCRLWWRYAAVTVVEWLTCLLAQVGP